MKIEPEQIQPVVAKLIKHGWAKHAKVRTDSTNIQYTEKGVSRMDDIAKLFGPKRDGISDLSVETLTLTFLLVGHLGLSSGDEIHAFNGLVQSWMADKFKDRN